MSKYQHRTNLTNNTAPSTSELEAGEIGINGASLGTAANGFNNGRLYIKLSNGEIRRFIGLGLPGTSDPSLKTKYGGTNNDFGTVSAPSINNNKPLMYFNYSANSNHTIDKTDNDTLTWDTANSRLKVGGLSTVAAAATLDVRGDVRIDTINASSSTFGSNSRIVGWDSGAKTLSAIDAVNFFTYFPSSSVPASKISGVLPLANGGTNVNFSSLGFNDGTMILYDATNTRLSGSSRLRWDTTNNVLNIHGNTSTSGIVSTTSYFENNVPNDNLGNAVPIGVDATNKIVRLDSTNPNNLSFSTVQISGGGNVVADSNADTLTLSAGVGIGLTVDSVNDTIIIANTSAGSLLYNGVNVTEISSTSTLSSTSNKYQFLTPNNNYDIILSVSSITAGREFVIRNLENTSGYTLTVYNSGVAGTVLATLDGTSSSKVGLFVFDGTSWRTALISQ